MAEHVTWRLRTAGRRIARKVFSLLFRDRDRDIRRSVMVAGTARSGTTWLAEIIASQLPCRLIFEPFHTRADPTFSPFHYFHYMRSDEHDDRLYAYCHDVFSGAKRGAWIDQRVDVLLPQYRLVKAVRANLFLHWLHTSFPDIPLVFIIRHPCAVVLSRMQRGWATDSDIKPFLSQPKLIEDYLEDKSATIEAATTPEEKHAVIWCIHNLVPLRQFPAGGLSLLFYENLCTQPDVEIPRVFQKLGHSYQPSVYDYARRPSSTSKSTSAIVSGNNPISHWTRELTSVQIHNILNVVRAFGLDHLYGDSLTPQVHTP